MKKNLFYYLFAVICSVTLFASCSDDDDDDVKGLTIDNVVGTFTGDLKVLQQPIPNTSITVIKEKRVSLKLSFWS